MASSRVNTFRRPDASAVAGKGSPATASALGHIMNEFVDDPSEDFILVNAARRRAARRLRTAFSHPRGTESQAEYCNRIKQRLRDLSSDDPKECDDVGRSLFDWLTDERWLKEGWDESSNRGQAPGVDGERYSDFSLGEAWDVVRGLKDAIRLGTYRPQPLRPQPVPKGRSPNAGTRELEIPVIRDRAVQRALVSGITPIIDPQLGEHVFGSRPGRSRASAARLLEDTFAQGLTVWSAIDIKNAFPSVYRPHALDALERHLPRYELHGGRIVDPRLLGLVGKIIGSGDGQGLPQGGPLSPLMLDVLLHSSLDQPLRETFPEIVVLRWIDDVLILAPSVSRAKQVHKTVARLLKAIGMRLKTEKEQVARDLLAGETVKWTGYQFGSRNNGLTVGPTDSAFLDLQQKLEACHEYPESPLLAKQIIDNFIDELTPCHDHVQRLAVLRKALSMAERLAFDELPTVDALRKRWDRRYEQWRADQNDPEPHETPKLSTEPGVLNEVPFDPPPSE